MKTYDVAELLEQAVFGPRAEKADLVEAVTATSTEGQPAS